jgi:uncharacterized protein YuzE
VQARFDSIEDPQPRINDASDDIRYLSGSLWARTPKQCDDRAGGSWEQFNRRVQEAEKLPQAERQTMTLKVDEKADALYLHLDDSSIIESEVVSPGVVLDFNADNQVVGVEILNLYISIDSQRERAQSVLALVFAKTSFRAAGQIGRNFRARCLAFFVNRIRSPIAAQSSRARTR